VDDGRAASVVVEGPGWPRGPFRAGSDVASLAGHALTPQARPSSLAGVERFDVRLAAERLRPFVPPEVFERIGESPSAPLRAERRDACAVFCEIEGWDGDVSALGDHYLAAWECARRHGGMLNKIDALPGARACSPPSAWPAPRATTSAARWPSPSSCATGCWAACAWAWRPARSSPARWARCSSASSR
jgi:hypothetical protein